jgi:hypothetical protein
MGVTYPAEKECPVIMPGQGQKRWPELDIVAPDHETLGIGDVVVGQGIGHPLQMVGAPEVPVTQVADQFAPCLAHQQPVPIGCSPAPLLGKLEQPNAGILPGIALHHFPRSRPHAVSDNKKFRILNGLIQDTVHGMHDDTGLLPGRWQQDGEQRPAHGSVIPAMARRSSTWFTIDAPIAAVHRGAVPPPR